MSLDGTPPGSWQASPGRFQEDCSAGAPDPPVASLLAPETDRALAATNPAATGAFTFKDSPDRSKCVIFGGRWLLILADIRLKF